MYLVSVMTHVLNILDTFNMGFTIMVNLCDIEDYDWKREIKVIFWIRSLWWSWIKLSITSLENLFLSESSKFES